MIRKKSGFTLVEILLAATLLGISSLAFITLYVNSLKMIQAGEFKSTTTKLTDRFMIKVNTDMNMSQINYNLKSSVNDQLDVDHLPMAWSYTGEVTPVDQCQSCPGRYGYVIRPYEKFRGLYQITLRLTHTEWKAQGESYRDYFFVVSAK